MYFLQSSSIVIFYNQRQLNFRKRQLHPFCVIDLFPTVNVFSTIKLHSHVHICIHSYSYNQRQVNVSKSQLPNYFVYGVGWLRLVGSLKSYVSFAKEPYKIDDILQKRPIILRSLLIVATS